jgi:hypothetical protein
MKHKECLIINIYLLIIVILKVKFTIMKERNRKNNLELNFIKDL